jgi:sugar O-acyltransferase (sialic acid O-acetyltransferase NeuD family)
VLNGVYLYGCGGHSLVVGDILERNGVPILGVYADKGNRHPKHLHVDEGIRLAGSIDCKDDVPFVLCVGNNLERSEIARMLGREYVSVIDARSTISPSASIGVGTVVLAGSIIQANAIIGNHVIINTAASIDHDNIIGDYAHVSPHATLCGHVEIGEGTHIGAGVTIIPSIKVGKWTTVGAGSVVLRDLPDGVVAVGVPARIIKEKSFELVG